MNGTNITSDYFEQRPALSGSGGGGSRRGDTPTLSSSHDRAGYAQLYRAGCRPLLTQSFAFNHSSGAAAALSTKPPPSPAAAAAAPRPWAPNPFPHTPRPVLPVPRLVPAAPRHPGAQWWMICGGAAALSTKPPPSPAAAGATAPRPWALNPLSYTPRPVLPAPRLVHTALRPPGARCG